MGCVDGGLKKTRLLKIIGFHVLFLSSACLFWVDLGLPCCAWLLSLRSTASAAPRRVGSSVPRDGTHGPCIGKQIPNTGPLGKSSFIFEEVYSSLVSSLVTGWITITTVSNFRRFSSPPKPALCSICSLSPLTPHSRQLLICCLSLWIFLFRTCKVNGLFQCIDRSCLASFT